MVLTVVAPDLLAAPILGLHDFRRPASLFSRSNFWKPSGTVSYAPRETSPGVTTGSLKHAVLFIAQLENYAVGALYTSEMPVRYRFAKQVWKR